MARRTSDAFTSQRPPREKREFYIPRLYRGQSLFGTQFEIKLRNELAQKAVAAECADWIRRKARFKSFAGGNLHDVTEAVIESISTMCAGDDPTTSRSPTARQACASS